MTAAPGLLYVEWFDYAERLLAGGALDWNAAEAVADLIGRAQALLPSDLVVLPLDRAIAAHIAAAPALRNAISSRPDGSQPVRAVLNDQALRTALIALVAQAAAATRGASFAIAMPAPDMLPGSIARAAGLPAPLIDEDLVDDTAVYTADFLRCFAQSPVAALVLDGEDGAFGALHAPILRVTDHYSWSIGYRRESGSIVAIPGHAAMPAMPVHRISIDTEPESARAEIATLRT